MIPLRRLCMFVRSTRGMIQKKPFESVDQTGIKLALIHTAHQLEAYERSKRVGNPHKREHLDGKESIPRWKLHWLYMMKRKAEIEEEVETPRSNQLNWNYESELEAFAHRLKIEVDSDVIRTAFTEPSNSEESSMTTNDNEALFHAGHDFTLAFIKLYVDKAFPKLGRECSESVVTYLTSESMLSYLAQNLGYPDLIQSSVYPITSTALYRCFLASIGTIICGPGGKIEAAKFIKDFVLVNLIDKDIVHDIWKPKDPMHALVKELEAMNIPPPEVRLTKQSGVNTVTPVYFIGLFCGRKLLSESGGESIIKAETDAAKLALKDIYDVRIDRYIPLVDVFEDPATLRDIEGIEIRLPETEPDEESGFLLKGEQVAS